jgi:hypothetical protein
VELFFESGYHLAICWEKVRAMVPTVRETFTNPLCMKNLEEAAKRYEAYLEKKSPGIYASLAASVRS